MLVQVWTAHSWDGMVGGIQIHAPVTYFLEVGLDFPMEITLLPVVEAGVLAVQWIREPRQVEVEESDFIIRIDAYS